MKFINQLMIKAIEENQMGELKKLLDGDIRPDEQDERGRTPLHCAVWKGNLRAVEMLIEAGAPLDMKDNIGAAPLHWAVRKQLLPITQALVAAGASPATTTTKNGLTPLHIAARIGHPETIKLLASPAAVNLRTTEGETALMMAADKQHFHAVVALLEAGANPDMQDGKGQTALHRAKAAAAQRVFNLLASRSAATELRNGTRLDITVGAPLKLKKPRRSRTQPK